MGKAVDLIDEAIFLCSSLDDIFMKYIISILEELGCEEHPQDVFDVEAFVEMMSACFPSFSTISQTDICTWMLELSAQLQTAKNRESLKSSCTGSQEDASFCV